MPYGGVKDSGNTREGPAFAVHELTEERFVTLPGLRLTGRGGPLGWHSVIASES